MRTSARNKAEETNSDFIGDEELDSSLNQGCRLIHGKIAQRFTDQLAVRGTLSNGGIFSVVSGTEGYSLPATVKKLIAVHARFNGSTSDNDWTKMDRLTPGNDRRGEYYPPRYGYPPAYGYEYLGSSIYFKPVPGEAFQVRLTFVPKFLTLVDVTDVPAFPDEFHELACEYAALQCLRKSGEGIYRESMELFQIELQNMLDTCAYANQQGEQMIITDDPVYWSP
jgi:hypothetical protein